MVFISLFRLWIGQRLAPLWLASNSNCSRKTKRWPGSIRAVSSWSFAIGRAKKRNLLSKQNRPTSAKIGSSVISLEGPICILRLSNVHCPLAELRLAQLALDPKNSPSWDVPEQERRPSTKMPLFVKSLPAYRSHHETEVWGDCMQFYLYYLDLDFISLCGLHPIAIGALRMFLHNSGEEIRAQRPLPGTAPAQFPVGGHQRRYQLPRDSVDQPTARRSVLEGSGHLQSGWGQSHIGRILAGNATPLR